MKPRRSMITWVSMTRRAVDLYQNGLGFPRQGEGDDVAFFKLKGTWLRLYRRKALAEDAQVDAEGISFNSFAIALNMHSEEEVDAVMKEALATGAELVKKPQEVFWGGYSGYLKDPDGHLWEVAHDPFTWIGPHDDSDA